MQSESLVKIREMLKLRSFITIEHLDGFGREEFLALATSCEAAQRFDDMVLILLEYLATLAPSSKLEDEERTLLSQGFKGIVQPLRQGILSLLESSKEENLTEKLRNGMLLLRRKLISELEIICQVFIEIANELVLLESAFQDADAIIWAYKTIGDHRRYEAEIREDGSEERSNAKELAEAAFSQGYSEAQIKLAPTSLLRLSLALNYACFCYEIMKDETKARTIAQDAIDAAETEITSLGVPQSSLYATDRIIHLIRKTMEQWKRG